MPQKGHRTKAGDRTRATVLQATIRLLARAGLEGFSASVLAKEAGVSKATLFHHFRTIDEIPLLALEQFWLESLSPDTAKTVSARVYLLQLGTQILNLAPQHMTFLRAHVVFLTKAMFDPVLRERLVGRSEEMHQRLTQELARRFPNNWSASKVDAVTRMVEMTLDGLMASVAVNNSAKALKDARQAWTRFVDLVLTLTEPG